MSTKTPTARPTKPQTKAMGIQLEVQLHWPNSAEILDGEEASPKSEKEQKCQIVVSVEKVSAGNVNNHYNSKVQRNAGPWTR